ncbi:MAG: putative toxin-antitoxin system toxin component, PIN family [Vulcanimicrobiota bacterium]
MRIVFDSNIYISAFLRPSGRAAIAFESAQKGHFLLFCSPDIVKEVAGKLRSKFLWEEMQTQNAVKRIVKASDKILQPQERVTLIEADDSDNRILECARAAKADLIVSQDHHLLDQKHFEGVPIVRLVDFLRIIGE